MPRNLLVCLAALVASPALAADAPVIREFRTQKVGDTTYFHLRLDTPRNLIDLDQPERFWLSRSPDPLREPRLVSPDGKARHIYQRRAAEAGGLRPGLAPRDDRLRLPVVPERETEPVRPDTASPEQQPPAPRGSVPVEGLEFVGKLPARGEIKLALHYPRESRLNQFRLPGRTPANSVRWEEATLTLDPAKAKETPQPAEAKVRRQGPGPKRIVENPVRDDLEGLWASAQADYFTRRAGEVSDFGFYSFASQATARKYFVPAMATRGWDRDRERFAPLDPSGGDDLHSLYDMTTGAAAIAESLALRRMAGPFGDDEKRTRDVAKLRGIDIAEHPWEKMMEGKKPAEETLAKLVPHDNYYIAFQSMRKFNEMSDQIDEWGTGLHNAWQMTSRDFRTKERYEQQLCLRSSALGRTLGPLVIKGLALTGSDGYLREGSDLTLLFQVNNKELFLAGVDTFIHEAKKKFGDSLKEGKSEHQGIAIQSFTTPLREVSTHRAIFDDYVVYSNSPAGIRRVLDAHKGKIKRLSESLDFQYMRTVFRADDKSEDGFVFLSDAFIRQLVGPASKIKEKRRVEALTSLYMITHGALFTAWETGKLPVAHREVLVGANLKPEETPMPEGKPAAWDAAKQLAFSEGYNTIHFATPLIELPIDKVTEAEAQQYENFRLQYLGLWRRYFDPIGIRFGLSEGQIKVDTYILPLIENSQYNELRRIAGGGTVSIDAGNLGPNTIFQYLIHLSPAVQRREEMLGLGRGRGPLDFGTLMAWGLDPVGKWAMVRLDDSPVYSQLFNLMEKAERGEDVDVEEIARRVFDVPVVIGVDIKNQLTFAAALAAARLNVLNSLPGITWEPMEKPYKDVSIVRVKASAATVRQLIGGDRRGRKPFDPAIYYAMIDSGFYLTPNEKMLHDLIDQAAAQKKEGVKKVEVNSSLSISPGAAKQMGELVRRYFERQVGEQALQNLPLWEALYQCGVVPVKADASETARVAYQYLGFLPTSPDGSAYRYDAAKGEVVNERHGSLRSPTPQKTLAENSPLSRLLEQLRSVRADLRFREDGIHTVLTIERNKGK